ncbi:hypothetical protein PMI41_00105 [Phyllobacterium sp. YR531]|nr:hypothetical protein PMI41_00105 [Phyllobacterium sp. YR531]
MLSMLLESECDGRGAAPTEILGADWLGETRSAVLNHRLCRIFSDNAVLRRDLGLIRSCPAGTVLPNLTPPLRSACKLALLFIENNSEGDSSKRCGKADPHT